MVNRERFLSGTVKTHNHQSQALVCAVAMSGASSLQSKEASLDLYTRARSHMEGAEMETDDSSFLNLETTQAMALVARFEFAAAKQRALLTLARLMRLLTLLGYDRLDGNSTGQRWAYTKPPQSPHSHTAALTHEKRCTFWIAFCMHCNSSGTQSHVLSSIPTEVCHFEDG